MMNKRVSVIIPTHNCSKYISEAVDSVLKQTYRDFEIIVVDDGSTDGTEKIVNEYIKKHPKKIRYFYQENKGPASARNKGIKEAEGEFIAFLDADDKWIEDKLGKSVKFIEDRGFDWICTAMTKYLEDGTTIIKRILNNSWVINHNTKEIKQLKYGLFFFSAIPVHTPTIVCKKICFDKVGFFDESFLVGEDTDLWLRFEESGLRGGYLDEPLTIYTYNENSITKGKKIDGLKEHSKVAKKHAIILGLSKPLIRRSYSEFLWQVADRYYSDSKYCNAMKYMIKSLYHNPANFLRIFKKLLCYQ